MCLGVTYLVGTFNLFFLVRFRYGYIRIPGIRLVEYFHYCSCPAFSRAVCIKGEALVLKFAFDGNNLILVEALSLNGSTYEQSTSTSYSIIVLLSFTGYVFRRLWDLSSLIKAIVRAVSIDHND